MRTVISVVLMLYCISGFTQDNSLPPEVNGAFQKKYAGSRIDDWWLEDSTNYYIGFTLTGHSYTALYDQKGTWKETAEMISDMDMPPCVADYIKKSFPTGRVNYCEVVESPGQAKYLRVNLMDSDYQTRVIRCNLDGKNIKVL